MKNMKYAGLLVGLALAVLMAVIGSAKDAAEQKADSAGAEAFFEMPASDYQPKTY